MQWIWRRIGWRDKVATVVSEADAVMRASDLVRMLLQHYPFVQAVDPERMPTGEIDFGLDVFRVFKFAKMTGTGIALVPADLCNVFRW